MAVKWEREEVEDLKPELWMLELLAMNPEYVYWGPDEDYMSVENAGWSSRLIIPTWGEFQWKLNCYNECVNFYFELDRPDGAKTCQVRLVLWILHPRKGCSRGVRIEKIERDELPAVFAFLRTAAERNGHRFSKVPK